MMRMRENIFNNFNFKQFEEGEIHDSYFIIVLKCFSENTVLHKT